MKNINKDIYITSLINEVEQKCGCISDLDRISEHPSYKKILEMGDYAIPFLLERIDKSVFWFVGLEILTNQIQEVRDSSNLRNKWKKWAKNNGY